MRATRRLGLSGFGSIEIPKVKSFKNRSRNFVEVMMKKNPCSLASATLLGLGGWVVLAEGSC